MWLVKASLVSFYARISWNTSQLYRVIAYITLSIIGCSYIIVMFFKTFYCFPLVKDLNHGDADGQSRVFDPSDQCTGGSVAQYTRTAYLLTTSLMDIITDLICLILPFCILRNLHISLRKKIALGVIKVNGFELTSRFSLPLPCSASFVAVSVSRSESREERNFKWRHGEWSKRQPRYALRPHQPFALYSSARRILCVEHPT